MIEHDAEDHVGRLLDELGTVDPPPDLVRRVMAQISHEGRSQKTGRVIPFERGRIAMMRKAMWGLAAAAAVALAVYTVIGFPPVNRGTEGTIGAAQKYQASQLTDKDVVLGNAAAQEFLQSEAFDRLRRDPQARALLSDTRIRVQLSQREFVDSIRQAEKRRWLTSDALYRIFEDKAAVAAIEAALAAGMSATAAVSQALNAAGLQVSTRAELKMALGDVGLMKAFEDIAVRKAMSNSEFRQAISDRNVAAALNSDVFATAIAHQGFSWGLQSGLVDNALQANYARQ